MNRVSTMAWPGGKCAYSWSYDPWGNRLNQDATGGTGPCGEHFPTVLPNNRISELGYDAAGNVTSNGATTYQYDAENRMVSINGGSGNNPSFVYDPDGGRVRKTVNSISTEFIYDLTGNVVAEEQGSTWTKSYVYLDGLPVAQYDNTVTPNTTFFVHKDHLGSTRLLTRLDKSVQQCLDYYPFGETETSPCTTPGSSTTAHQVTGKEADPEGALDYFGARYYASFHGR
jgi:YD repeat-containing protein